MKNYSIIICISHLQDKSTGLHSYINCIDSGHISGTPVILPGFSVISKWDCSKNLEGMSAELVCLRPGKKKDIISTLDEFNVQEGLFTLIMAVDQIEILDAGRHEIQIVIRDKMSKKLFSSIKYPLQMTLLNKK